MTPPTPWLKDRNASPNNLKVFDKLTKRRDKHIDLQGTEKRERQRERERSQKGKKIGAWGPKNTPFWLYVLVEKVLAQNIAIFPKGLIICIK